MTSWTIDDGYIVTRETDSLGVELVAVYRILRDASVFAQLFLKRMTRARARAFPILPSP